MKKLVLTIRFLLFCLFFSIGGAAIALSILIEPEIVNYYQNRVHLVRIEEANAQIRRLTEQYDAQIRHLQENPQLLAKLQTITFGRQPAAEGTVLPRASDEHLDEAKEALFKELARQERQSLTPEWVSRCADTKNRKIIFTAGSALVLVTFVFFGTTPRRRAQALAPTP